jgi:Fe-S-cluster-containing dehydrogenase component
MAQAEEKIGRSHIEALNKLFSKSEVNREKFLKITGLASLACVAAAVESPFAAAADAVFDKTKRKHHWGMVIDLVRCVNCKACTIACKLENKTPPGMLYNPVIEEETGTFPNVHRRWFPKPCYHCENPPCVPVCPVDATSKRPEDGIVVVDYDKCEGYGDCVTACPYESRHIDDGKNYIDETSPFNEIPSPEYKGIHGLRRAGQSPIGKVRKCTFCLHLQDEDGNYTDLPACARTCMGKAIRFGDFMDPSSEVSSLIAKRNTIRLKEELGTEPSVYYAM